MFNCLFPKKEKAPASDMPMPSPPTRASTEEVRAPVSSNQQAEAVPPTLKRVQNSSANLMTVGRLDSLPLDLSPTQRRDRIMKYKPFIYSSTGPKHPNEDRYLYAVLPEIDTPSMRGLSVICFGVFDGHGGDTCSQYLAHHLTTIIYDSEVWDKTDMTLPAMLKASVEDALATAEKEFCDLSAQMEDKTGSCVIFGVMCQGYVVTANIGDALGIIYTPGIDGNGTWVELSQAHRSYEEAEMKRIQAAGGIVVNRRAFGVLEPSRSIGDLAIKLACIGAVTAQPHVAECFLSEYHNPTVNVGVPRQNSSGIIGTTMRPFIIIASDGLWDFVDMEKIVKQTEKLMKKNSNKKVISNADNPSRNLVRTAIRAGSLDDVTSMVLEVF